MQFIKLGTPKQAKQAMKCMYMNMKTTDNQDKVFSGILYVNKENLMGGKEQALPDSYRGSGTFVFLLAREIPRADQELGLQEDCEGAGDEGCESSKRRR